MRVWWLLFPLCFAISLQHLSITVKIQGETGIVQEKYVFSFLGPADKKVFESYIEQCGSDLFCWSRAFEEIDYHIGGSMKELENVAISVSIEEKSATLILSYKVPVAKKISESWRIQRWIVNRFHFSKEGDLFYIPGTVRIILPKGARIISVLPSAKIEEQSVVWEGPLTTSSIFVEFELIKPVVFKLPEIKIPSQLLLGISLAFVGLLFVFRRRIREAVIRYVETHTDFESFSEE